MKQRFLEGCFDIAQVILQPEPLEVTVQVPKGAKGKELDC